MKWLRDIIKEPHSEKISHSRILAVVAMTVSSWVVIRMELRGATSVELVLGYLGILVTGEVTKRIGGRYEEKANKIVAKPSEIGDNDEDK